MSAPFDRAGIEARLVAHGPVVQAATDAVPLTDSYAEDGLFAITGLTKAQVAGFMRARTQYPVLAADLRATVAALDRVLAERDALAAQLEGQRAALLDVEYTLKALGARLGESALRTLGLADDDGKENR